MNKSPNQNQNNKWSLKKVKLTLIEIFYTNFFFSIFCYLDFDPYNPPHLPSHYSLIPLPPLLNYQFL